MLAGAVVCEKTHSQELQAAKKGTAVSFTLRSPSTAGSKPATASPAASTVKETNNSVQKQKLKAAFDIGALSEEQYNEAVRELDGPLSPPSLLCAPDSSQSVPWYLRKLASGAPEAWRAPFPVPSHSPAPAPSSSSLLR